jgi:hypothetical protein
MPRRAIFLLLILLLGSVQAQTVVRAELPDYLLEVVEDAGLAEFPCPAGLHVTARICGTTSLPHTMFFRVVNGGLKDRNVPIVVELGPQEYEPVPSWIYRIRGDFSDYLLKLEYEDGTVVVYWLPG